MSLEGSLETVALPEVLQLLSDTSKTGELLVRGDRGEGRIWFGQGRLTGFQVARSDQPADALFDLLRNSEGRFEFQADAERPDDAHQVGEDENEVRPVLDVAQARLAEWTEIVAIIPSLRHIVRLAEEAPRARLHLDAAQWSLIVAVGEGREVRDILERAALPEFDGCKSLKVLVNSGLATVVEPVVEEVHEPVAELAEEPVAEVADEPFGDVIQEALAEASFEPGQAETAPVEAEVASAYEAPVYEAPLDPHEYVFSAPASSEEPAEEAAGEELAPWSVALADASSNGAEDVDFVPQHVPYPEVHDEHEGNGANPARSALEALLAEIPAEEDGAEGSHDNPDGLADRGPWTSNELADMSNWHNEEEPSEVTSWGSFQVTTSRAPYDGEAHHGDSAAEQDQAAAHHSTVTDSEVDESDDADEPEPQPEQVNRGLLLKFLSSVRS